MHHSNKNLAETCGIDMQPDNAIHAQSLEQSENSSNVAPASMEEYLHSCGDQSVVADSNSNSVDETLGNANAMSVNNLHNKTLFNIRFTSLGKRLSDRIELQDEENYVTNGVLNPQINGGKKSRQSGHVTFQNFKENTFRFVPNKATRFSKRSSSSDVNLKALSVGDSEDETEDSDSCEEADSDSDVEPLVNFHLGNDWVINTLRTNNPETQKTTHMVTDATLEHSTLFPHDSKENLFHEESPEIVLRNKAKLTPLLDKNIHLPQLIDSVDTTSLKVHFSEQDIHESELSPPQRGKHKTSSGEKKEVVNISDVDKSFASNIVTSEVSKETDRLQNIGSTSSLCIITSVDNENKTVRSRSERSLIDCSAREHQLQSSVFTEFVNIDDFQASVRSRIPHLGDGCVIKNDKQLEVLLRGGPSKSLKSYLRNSQWPAESGQRSQLWENLCYHLLQADENLYQKLVNDMLSEDAEGGLTLPSFVEPEIIHAYFLTAQGLEHVRNILCLLNQLHPDITYCPMLHPMCCLFLHYMSPQACFNCLQALLRNTRSCYFTQTYIKTQASKYVLRGLAKKYAKQAHDLMAQGGRKVEDIFDNWMWWIFRDLPFQYLVRIVDSFLLEGYKIFYRITLAVVILFAKGYSKSASDKASVEGFSADISSFCRNISVAPRKLIQVAFGIRGLSRREIFKLHDKNEAFITSLPARKHISKVRLKELVPSAILTPDMLQQIWQWIPTRLSLMKLKLLFSSNEDGTAIRTLYTRAECAEQTILAIKTTNSEIFGAFCSSSWYTRHEQNKPKTSFFGTGETFVFSIVPDVKRYPWTGMLENPPNQTADLFMAGDDHMLIIGSGNGTAIYLDAMMNRCSSTHCDTFNNHSLCSTSDFSCRVVEVFGFTE
ncbi:hypothetical protein BsWGS_09602 [Bradybaena similaris]